jgi:hypothetical protein
MNFFWVAIPIPWDLQDCQAALNVIVTVLSAICIFVFARACWQNATAKVAKSRNVPLAALLSVNTLGEVIDVCRLLKLEILSSYYIRILAQCLVVTALTILAFASGPIVRYSSRWGTKMVYREVPGLMANRLQSGISHEGVLWNSTWESLNYAGFPEDQLLDFLPNITSKWKYSPDQWNSSYKMDCEYTEQTKIELTVVQTPCNGNTTINDQIPAFESIYPENEFFEDGKSWTYNNIEGFQDADDDRWSHLIMFRTGFTRVKRDEDSKIVTVMVMTLVAAYLEGIQGTPYNETYCSYMPGPVDSAIYTKSVCKLSKIRDTAPGKFYVDTAYPDHVSMPFLSKAMTDYFQGQYSREIIAKEPYTIVSPQNLTRFYQVYQITQDTQAKHPNKRMMDLEIKICEISTIFIIVTGFFFLLCIFGVLRYGIFTLRHHKTVDRTPQSKLDWMIQSIEKNGPQMTPLVPGASPYMQPNPYVNTKRARHSVTSMRSPDVGSPTAERRRSDFESATYGSSPEASTPQPYHMSWLSRQSSGGGYFPLQEHPMESEQSLMERYPTAPAGPLNNSQGAMFNDDYRVSR